MFQARSEFCATRTRYIIRNELSVYSRASVGHTTSTCRRPRRNGARSSHANNVSRAIAIGETQTPYSSPLSSTCTLELPRYFYSPRRLTLPDTHERKTKTKQKKRIVSPPWAVEVHRSDARELPRLSKTENSNKRE